MPPRTACVRMPHCWPRCCDGICPCDSLPRSTTDDPAVLSALMPWWHFVSEPRHERVRWTMCAREICFKNDLLRRASVRQGYITTYRQLHCLMTGRHNGLEHVRVVLAPREWQQHRSRNVGASGSPVHAYGSCRRMTSVPDLLQAVLPERQDAADQSVAGNGPADHAHRGRARPARRLAARLSGGAWVCAGVGGSNCEASCWSALHVLSDDAIASSVAGGHEQCCKLGLIVEHTALRELSGTGRSVLQTACADGRCERLPALYTRRAA